MTDTSTTASPTLTARSSPSLESISSSSATPQSSGQSTPSVIGEDHPVLNEFIIPTTAFYPPPTVNTPELPTEDKESTGMDEKASQGGPLTGPNSLPIRGQRGAPTKFTGRYDAVVTFLQHYERLCIKHSVVSDLDKVECITQYCSRAVKEFMEGLSSFQERSWSAFKFDILKYFDAERDAGRHLVSDL